MSIAGARELSKVDSLAQMAEGIGELVEQAAELKRVGEGEGFGPAQGDIAFVEANGERREGAGVEVEEGREWITNARGFRRR